MKQLTLLCLLTFSIFSCEKEDNSTGEIQRIKIDNLLQYLPLDSLMDKSKAVFTSVEGDEKVLSLEIIEDVKTQIINNTYYESEDIYIGYNDPSTFDYYLYIKAIGVLTDDYEQNLFITAQLTQFITDYVPTIIISDSGAPQFLSKFHESKIIAGKSFENVYSSLRIEGQDAFGTIDYTTELGIVGFTDENGMVFSLKELIE
jgi:hypothetical protein